jgi:tripartite-type tricarboxylate transporter receptor subunit TctC
MDLTIRCSDVREETMKHRAQMPKMLMIVLLSGAAQPGMALADDFFAGKTITLSTHSEKGGGYEAYLRLLAEHMGRHIPGRPSFAILNQPGSGGLVAVNHAANVAPQDGTFLTIVSQSVPVIEAAGGAGLQTSLGAFKWIGNFTRANNVTVTWASSNVKSLQDAKTREVVMGATGAGTSSEMGPILYNSLVGTRFKIVTGYSGAEALNEAMKRGEIDGRANSTWASIKLTLLEEFKDGKVNVLIQMGLRKERELPDVPLLSELVKGDAKGEAIAKFMSLSVTAARPLAATPGVPDERVAVLRRAFDTTMQDPEFLAAAKMRGTDIDPMTGEETQAIITAVLATPKEVLVDLKAALGGFLK